jgi:hypothetical protein
MLKMAKRKVKRNARRSKPRGEFSIAREPVISVERSGSADSANGIGLSRSDARPMLFAIARDARTIFASWTIDWPSVFRTAMPADRKIYLHLINKDGLEQGSVVVEPMTLMHYVTIPFGHESWRVEIGYFQPGGTWHSVAMSNPVNVPRQESSGSSDLDLATIPFHLAFQELVDLFGAGSSMPLAKVVSSFQRHVLNNGGPNELSSAEQQIIDKLNLSLRNMKAAQRKFRMIDTEKLARRTRALAYFNATSRLG